MNEHTDGSEYGNRTAEPVDEANDGTGEDREASDEPSGRSAWGALSELQEAVGGLVDSALKSVAPAAGRFPRYDLIEIPRERYLLLFDLPGLEKSDVDVTARGGEVAVEGTRARPTVPEGAEVLRSERMYGRFRRSVRVPGDVDLARVSAKMTNGVLEIRLPKRSSEDAQHVTVE